MLTAQRVVVVALTQAALHLPDHWLPPRVDR